MGTASQMIATAPANGYKMLAIEFQVIILTIAFLISVERFGQISLIVVKSGSSDIVAS